MSTEVVSTNKGKIRGKVFEVKDKIPKPIHVYRKIPFAKPPVGELRFMPPQPADPWEGVIDGTTVGNMPMCATGDAEAMEKALPLPHPDDPLVPSEDCLHLTVYSPCPEKGKNLPVMMWFYGGGFTMGCERDYDGSALAAMNDVIVVVPNYRVGIFGFFSLGKDSVCTGNAGLLDQQLALKWVQENIDVFGGDRDNVTIFGESAGGISVHHHIVSPLSRSLFHKAISHSGQASIPILFNGEKENGNVKDVTLKHFKIDETDDLKILEAMQKIPAKELTSIQPIHEQARIQFSPMVDGKFFDKNPKQYLADNEFSKVPYIIGCNSTEGAGVFGIFASPDFEKGVAEDIAKTSQYFRLSDEGFEKCKEFYEIKKMGDDRFSKLMAYIVGDSSFVAPAAHDADVHAASGAAVYKYIGNFALKMFHDDEYGNVTKRPSWCICDHVDDVYMTLGHPFTPYPQPNGAKYSEEERKLSRKWMTYITNFAKTGDPNLGNKVETQWPKYEPGGDEFLIDHTMSTVKGFRMKEAKFWLEIMPSHISSY